MRYWSVWIIFLVALLNLGYVILIRDPSLSELVSDSALFKRIANNLANHFVFSSAQFEPYEFSVVKPALYPLLIAGIMLFTTQHWEIILVALQSIIYLVTIVLIYRIAMCLAYRNARQIALIAAFIAACFPHLACMSQVLMIESIATFLVTLIVWLAVRKEMLSWGGAFGLGLCWGLLILLRPTFLLFPLVSMVCMLSGGFRCLIANGKRLSFAFVVTLLLLLPWGLVNLKNTGVFTVACAGAGYNLINGLAEADQTVGQARNSGRMRIQWDDSASVIHSVVEGLENGDIPMLASGQLTSPAILSMGYFYFKYKDSWTMQPPPPNDVAEADAFLKKLAIAWIIAHPYEYGRVLLLHAKSLIYDYYHPYYYQLIPAWFERWADVAHLLLLLLTICGIAALFLNRERRLWITAISVPVYLLIIHAPGHVEQRYFIQGYPVMILAAAAGALLCYRHARNFMLAITRKNKAA